MREVRVPKSQYLKMALIRMKCSIKQTYTFFTGLGSEEDSSARGSPSAMELTVGGTLHRLGE